MAILLIIATFRSGGVWAADVPPPDYAAQIAPIFERYCTACHNADDREGELNLESHDGLLEGGERGPAITPGSSPSSRLVRVLTGEAKPVMPPDDNEPPTADEIALIRAWIDGGATGPDGSAPDRKRLRTPAIPAPAGVTPAITSVAYAPDGRSIAAARFRRVEWLAADNLEVQRTWEDHPGKVNAVSFCSDGTQLVVASGIAGLYGQARLWGLVGDAPDRTFTGHRDILYSAVLSADGSRLATGSYDHSIVVWDVATGDELQRMKGHNGAIYDLAFSPDGQLLASASADATVKLWNVSSSALLDTLSQPLKEQYTVAFSPDGRHVVAGGVDNRIRVWRVVSHDKPAINPLLYARFAHEGAIVQLAYSGDGATLASAAEDRLVKLWETSTYTQLFVYEPQSDIPSALAVSPDGDALVVGRMDGTLQIYPIDSPRRSRSPDRPTPLAVAVPEPAAVESAKGTEVDEVEPNDSLETATPLALPAVASGRIHAAGRGSSDVDLYRFESNAGATWTFQVRAAQDESPLDSKIEILDGAGEKVLRVWLKAVRDSYIAFRGIDSTTRDVRLFNWEEMQLNQYLYIQGEVCKLLRSPRGPDSGYLLYPNDGSRYGYFDTSATSHPLHQTCYIVEPYPPGTELAATGLPVFPLYYENDDDGLRRLGTDSRLMFTAPTDGEFFVRVTDVRGYEGHDFKYKLTGQPARPDFEPSLDGKKPKIGLGSGRGFSVKVQRTDGFDGPVTFQISGIPPGYFATSPIVIQPGHDIAWGAVYALPGASAPQPGQADAIQVTATAMVGGLEVTKDVENFGELNLDDKPKVTVSLAPPGMPPPLASVVTEGEDAGTATAPPPFELVIAPGQTITATLRAERLDFKDRIQLEDRNLPHGVIVDNIGLSGILIPEGQTERTIYLTADKWVPETRRLFYLEAKTAGQPATWPVMLHVRRNDGQK